MNGPPYAERFEQVLDILPGFKLMVVVNFDLQCSNSLLHGNNFGLYILQTQPGSHSNMAFHAGRRVRLVSLDGGHPN